ncbi:MAG TPA: hypothetical protein VF796_14760 [Humisphaera sp.]
MAPARPRVDVRGSPMPGFYLLTYLPSARTEHYADSRGYYYRLGDGREIDVRVSPVWCPRCSGVTDGEEIEPVREIDMRIADAERLAAEIRRDMETWLVTHSDAPGDRIVRADIEALRLRRSWRERRVSPPRCLDCGSTGILPLPQGKPVRVPGGSIRCECIGHCSTILADRYFTAEGERIAGGTRA